MIANLKPFIRKYERATHQAIFLYYQMQLVSHIKVTKSEVQIQVLVYTLVDTLYQYFGHQLLHYYYYYYYYSNVNPKDNSQKSEFDMQSAVLSREPCNCDPHYETVEWSN